jgi:anti-anti-sigma factor
MRGDNGPGPFRVNGALRMSMMGSPPGLAIGGEIDLTTYAALVRKLAEVARGCDQVHVDLSAVEYCDVAGLRAVVRLATPGRTVVLHGLSAPLLTVLSILGWDSTPGLVIKDSPAGLARR